MRFLRHAKIDSTSAEIRRLADAGDPGDVWVQADIQTAGRGRRGREWQSPKGNLFCTGLFSHEGDIASAAQMGFIAALAVAHLCEAYVPGIKPEIKWPNDVLIDGAKISGILLESGNNKGRLWVSVGIGINLVNHPTDLSYPATNLAAHIDSVDPESIPDPMAALAVLAREFEILRGLWLTEGFTPIREAWLASANGIGKTVTANLLGETVIGTMIGMAENGELQVRLPDGRDRLITSGEVFFS